MKKRIFFGCIFTVFLLMLLPSVYATEFRITSETYKSYLYEKLQHNNIENLFITMKKSSDSLVSQFGKILTLLILLTLFRMLLLYMAGFRFLPEPGNQPPNTPEPPS